MPIIVTSLLVGERLYSNIIPSKTQIYQVDFVFIVDFIMKRFGEKLRTLRIQKGLSVRKLASALDIKSSGHITELEKGRRYPSIPLLIRMSLFFNVTSDQLIRDDLELD